jgi:hypothetical protein
MLASANSSVGPGAGLGPHGGPSPSADLGTGELTVNASQPGGDSELSTNETFAMALTLASVIVVIPGASTGTGSQPSTAQPRPSGSSAILASTSSSTGDRAGLEVAFETVEISQQTFADSATVQRSERPHPGVTYSEARPPQGDGLIWDVLPLDRGSIEEAVSRFLSHFHESDFVDGEPTDALPSWFWVVTTAVAAEATRRWHHRMSSSESSPSGKRVGAVIHGLS